MPALETKIITRYDYEAQAEASKISEVFFDKKKDKSLTVQSDMDAADINKIMARYEKTGLLIDPLGVERKPMYGDFTEVKDYHTTLSALKRTEAAFNLLPAPVRNRFNNDPEALIKFLDDPANDQEAVKLGLKDRSVLKDLPEQATPGEAAGKPEKTPPGPPAGQPQPAA